MRLDAPQLGDVVHLKTGEKVRIRTREFTEGGLALWILTCKTGQWRGVLPLTTRELHLNAA